MIGLGCGLMNRVELKIVCWPVMMNFQVREVFVLVSIGFDYEFVGFVGVSGNDGEKRVFSNKPPSLVDSEEFFQSGRVRT